MPEVSTSGTYRGPKLQAARTAMLLGARELVNALAPARSFVPLVVLVLLWIVAVRPWLAGGMTIPYDAKDYAYPAAVFTALSLLRGEAPFWNPYLFAGYPSFADPQAMTFTPTVVLPMLLSQSIVWFDVVILLHVLGGGIGVLRLSRSYRWSGRAALVAALVFMFGGVASSRLQHSPMIVVWSFVPWMFVAIRALFQQPSLRTAAVLGAVVGLAALQLTQVTYLALLTMVAYAVFRLAAVLRSRGASVALEHLGFLLVAALLSFVVAAPQIVATLSVLPYTNRADIDIVIATRDNSLTPTAFATLTSPNVLGSLSGSYIGPNDITETYFYLGAFPLVLLLCGFFGRGPALDRGERIFWRLVLALSVLYMLGGNTPAYSWLHQYLPGVSLFRRPSDAAFVFVFSAAILIGASMDLAPGGGNTATWRSSNTWHVGAFVAFVGVMAVVLSTWFRTSTPWVGLGLLAVAFVCYVGMRSSARPRGWYALLATAIFADIALQNVGNRMNAHHLAALVPTTSLEHNVLMNDLAQRLPKNRYFRVELEGPIGGPNAPEAVRIPSVGGYKPMLLLDYAAFTGISEPLLPRRSTGAFDSYGGKLNDLLGVRYVAAVASSRDQIEGQLGPWYRVVADSDGRVIWENSRALSRLLRPQEVLSAPAPSAFTPSMLNFLDLEHFAYVEAQADVLARCNGGRANDAEIRSYANNEVTIDVQTDRFAWIVLNDVYFDGWRAEVSGNATPIYRANGIFRALCVPPGRHSVRFSFEPYRHLVGRLRTALFGKIS